MDRLLVFPHLGSTVLLLYLPWLASSFAAKVQYLKIC